MIMLAHPWPTAEEIAQHQSGDQRWSCFDLSDCDHPVYTISYAGQWESGTCIACGVQVYKACTHEKCEWNDEGTLLRCTTCGIDGT